MNCRAKCADDRQDRERRDTLERVLDWWNFGARFVLESVES